MSPIARASDPDTSHEAAASVQHLREKQSAVLCLFMTSEPMIDEELINIYRSRAERGVLPMQSTSGL